MENECDKVVCCNCGELLDEAYSYMQDGECYCESCYDDIFTTCHNCGEIIKIDEATCDANDDLYCDECADRCLYTCRFCDGLFADDDGEVIGDGSFVCDDCRRRNCVRCEGCGEYFCEDDMEYNEDDDCYYCQDCCERNVVIRDYGYKPTPIFSDTNNRSSNLHFGLELEVDGGYNAKETATKVLDKFGDRLYIKHDGSLHDGFEIVTHPMDWKEFSKFNWSKVFDICKSEGFKSGDTSTCGLHFHFDREFLSEKSITNLQIVINNCFDKVMKISRRKGDYQYCEINYDIQQRLHKYRLNADKIKSIMKIIGMNQGRFLALNLRNSGTIEFRFFKGTLNYDTFMLSARFVYELCKIATRLPIEKSFAWSNWYWKLSKNVREFYDNKGKSTKYNADEYAKEK